MQLVIKDGERRAKTGRDKEDVFLVTVQQSSPPAEPEVLNV